MNNNPVDKTDTHNIGNPPTTETHDAVNQDKDNTNCIMLENETHPVNFEDIFVPVPNELEYQQYQQYQQYDQYQQYQPYDLYQQYPQQQQLLEQISQLDNQANQQFQYNQQDQQYVQYGYNQVGYNQFDYSSNAMRDVFFNDPSITAVYSVMFDDFDTDDQHSRIIKSMEAGDKIEDISLNHRVSEKMSQLFYEITPESGVNEDKLIKIDVPDDQYNISMYSIFLAYYSRLYKASSNSNKSISFIVYRNKKIPSGIYTIVSSLSYIIYSPFGRTERYSVIFLTNSLNYYILKRDDIISLIADDLESMSKIIGQVYIKQINQTFITHEYHQQQTELIKSMIGTDVNLPVMESGTTVNLPAPVGITVNTPPPVDETPKNKIVQIDGKTLKKRGRKPESEQKQYLLSKAKQTNHKVVRNVSRNTKQDAAVTKVSLPLLFGDFKTKKTSRVSIDQKNEQELIMKDLENANKTAATSYHYVNSEDTGMEYIPIVMEDIDNDPIYRRFLILLGQYGTNVNTLETLKIFDEPNLEPLTKFGKDDVELTYIDNNNMYTLINMGTFSRVSVVKPPSGKYEKMSITGFFSPSSMGMDIDVHSLNNNVIRLIDVSRIRDQNIRLLLKSPDIPWYQIVLIQSLHKEQTKFTKQYANSYGPTYFKDHKDKMYYKLLYTTRIGKTNANVNFNPVSEPTLIVGFENYSIKSRSNNIVSIMLLTKPSPIVFSYTTKGHREAKTSFEKEGTVSYVATINGKKSVIRRHGKIKCMVRTIKGFSNRVNMLPNLMSDKSLNYEFKYINEIIFTSSTLIIMAYIIPYIANNNREAPYVYDLVVLFYDTQTNCIGKYTGTDFFIYEESVRDFIDKEILNIATRDYVYDVLPAAIDEEGDVLPRVVNLDNIERVTTDNTTAMEIEK